MVVVGDVGVVQINPIGHALGERVPQLGVLADAVLAGGVVLGNAIGLDVFAGFQTQLLFDLDLHGQAVGVPAGLAVHAVAAHGFIATERVLDRARQHMVHSGTAIGRWWTFVEREGWGISPLLDGTLEDLLAGPPIEALGLHGLVIELSDFRKAGHGHAGHSLERGAPRPGTCGADAAAREYNQRRPGACLGRQFTAHRSDVGVFLVPQSIDPGLGALA